MVKNVHERTFQAEPVAAGQLIDQLASPEDLLWPGDRWPPIRFSGPLREGATGGHGPVRYTVEAYEPGHSIRFRFTAPRGFLGTHSFEVEEITPGVVRCRHAIVMDTRGSARLSWPLLFRPLHDALIEDAFDRAEAHCTGVGAAHQRRWSWRVRLLRRLMDAIMRRRTTRDKIERAGAPPEARSAGSQLKFIQEKVKK